MTQLAQKRIVCAACKFTLEYGNEEIVLGARHYDKRMHATLDIVHQSWEEARWKPEEIIQGFIDQFGDFHDRKEALAIAEAAGQIGVYRPKTAPKDELFSEDLY